MASTKTRKRARVGAGKILRRKREKMPVEEERRDGTLETKFSSI